MRARNSGVRLGAACGERPALEKIRRQFTVHARVRKIGKPNL
jgi:hypothetical protein